MSGWQHGEPLFVFIGALKLRGKNALFWWLEVTFAIFLQWGGANERTLCFSDNTKQCQKTRSFCIHIIRVSELWWEWTIIKRDDEDGDGYLTSCVEAFSTQNFFKYSKFLAKKLSQKNRAHVEYRRICLLLNFLVPVFLVHTYATVSLTSIEYPRPLTP